MKRIIALALILVSITLITACTAGDDKKSIAPVEATLAVDTDSTGVVLEDTAIENKTITIGKKEYEFPILISRLIDDGWYFDESVRSKLEPVEGKTSKLLSDINLYHDEYEHRIMLLDVNNDSEEKRPLRDCYLTKIGVNRSMASDPDSINIVLPGGITWQSTAADVMSVYGTKDNHPYFTAATLKGSSADYVGNMFCVSFTFTADGKIEYICFS